MTGRPGSRGSFAAAGSVDTEMPFRRMNDDRGHVSAPSVKVSPRLATVSLLETQLAQLTHGVPAHRPNSDV
jgi:hypothetical protein